MQNIIWILNTLPYRGKIEKYINVGGKPLHYKLSFLQDLPVAKVSSGTNYCFILH